MKILVPITEAATVDTVFEIDGLDIDDRYLSTDLNEWDAYALEEAVQLVEAEGGEVVTVTIGPDDVEETIQAAREYDGPSVVDAIIDPAENVYPMVPSGGDNGLFALNERHLEQL